MCDRLMDEDSGHTHGLEKLGLALSGGGFRASFFHLGVLAQMAMQGLLRHVEVISAVSGGAIIGAFYYLHLKKLLDQKPDKWITDKDYVVMMENIECEFFDAVRRNIRMLTFSNPIKNILMTKPNYSRSDRVGELYDKYLYREAFDPARTKPVQMRELKILPQGRNFHPRKDNATRKAKVPILLINATALNTGHNWRFEASQMGEPPRADQLSIEIDKNARLQRPPSYSDMVPRHCDLELGLAVAASACVPAIFHPLAISGLYEGVRVQLVDGGVHDNQGIQGLIDEHCTRFIVSDAGGQLTDDFSPATGIPAVLTRTREIVLDRLREEQMYRLFEHHSPSGSRIAFLHLKKGLEIEEKPWIDQRSSPAQANIAQYKRTVQPEDFGVATPVQALISGIRTDLDSFTEIEAYSLMLDGYQMSEGEFQTIKGIRGMTSRVDRTPRWRFLSIAPLMIEPTPEYKRHLDVASQQFFKPFRLSRPLAIISSCIGIGILAAVWALSKDVIISLLSRSVTVSKLMYAVIVILLGFVPRLSRTFRVLRFLQAPTRFIVRLVVQSLLPALGALFVNVHLWVFNPLFLRLGRMDRVGLTRKRRAPRGSSRHED